MIKAVAYYRVASPDGAEKGLQRQKEVVGEYAKKNGYEITAEVEAIESGCTADRESLRRVKQDLDRTGSGTVLARNIDRLVRNPLEIEKVAECFGNAVVEVAEGIKFKDGILMKPDWICQAEEQMDGYTLKMDAEKFYHKTGNEKENQ